MTYPAPAKMTKIHANNAASEFESLDTTIKELTKQRDALKVKLLAYAELHKEKAETANYVIARIASYRFDDAKIQKAFPVEKHPSYYKIAIDTSALHDALTKAQARQYQKPSYSLSVVPL